MSLNPTSNDIYLALIGTAFEPEGKLKQALDQAGRGHRRIGAQSEYAQHVASTFAAGRGQHGITISLLEGEAGLGKTLGYLVPMAVWCALRDSRGLLSVPLAAMTDRNLAAELAAASAVAFDLTGKTVTFARSFAARDFLSRDKIIALRAHLPARGDIEAALNALERACDDGGLLADVLRDHGPLPSQIRLADICGDESGDAYQTHLGHSAAADIILVPHGLLLDNLTGNDDALASDSFACAVVDEVEHFLPEANPRWDAPFIDALCLTGAALDLDGNDQGFRALRDRLGLNGQVEEALSGRFVTPRFGALAFSLSHPSAPRPTVEGEKLSRDNPRNPRWYDYVEGVLAEVAALRQRTLVLTCNHQDTAELTRRLAAQDVHAIAYGPSDRLADVVAAFVANPAAILIGANFWERVNLPGLIKHLVVTRLPIGHFSGPAVDGLTASETERHVLSAVMRAARLKLKLGLGRAIRSASDDVHLWITDPRFPLPSSFSDNPRLQLPPYDASHKAFSACIPERFRAGLFATYPQAALIDPELGAGRALRPAKRQARQ